MKHFEFWHPRLFEIPYYLYLLMGGLARGVSPKTLAKANYALDHGEIGIGSKLQTQMAFPQERFLPTIALPESMATGEKEMLVQQFVKQHGLPFVLKSDIGSVGKGVVKVNHIDEIPKRVAQLVGPYLAQAFTPNNYEYGVFYVRQFAEPRITAINKKHFPSVIGDGQQTLGALAQAHPRHSNHWGTFLQYADLEYVPQKDERVQLSFIGSHTMGCMFTDDTHLLTGALERAVFEIFDAQPGFNFGRLDVKAPSEEAFQAGEFTVIEVNGVASLPTTMFDPNNSLLQAYRIFLRHGRYLLDIARQHRHRDMALRSYADIIQQVRQSARKLNASHQELMH